MNANEIKQFDDLVEERNAALARANRLQSLHDTQTQTLAGIQAAVSDAGLSELPLAERITRIVEQRNTLRTQLAAAQAVTDLLDAVVFNVWLHADWRQRTRSMPTPEKNAAADAVMRHSHTRHLDDPADVFKREDLAWWDKE